MDGNLQLGCVVVITKAKYYCPTVSLRLRSLLCRHHSVSPGACPHRSGREGLGVTHGHHNGRCPFEHTVPRKREAKHTSYKNSGPYFERPTVAAACPLAFFFCVIYMRVCVDEYIRNGSLLLAAEVGGAAGRQGN